MFFSVAHTDRAMHMRFVFLEQSRCPDQHGCVRIVAAGVHFVCVPGGKRQIVIFGHGQGIHLSSKQNVRTDSFSL